MTPLWPFKKKAVAEEQPPAPIAYDRNDDSAAKILSDTAHTDSQDYKAAMATLSNPTLEAPAEQASAVPEKEYIQSNDGYWYLKRADGSFEPEAYVKNEDGTFQPFSAN